jgi:glycosyltransferase involved in cell wall biosynthesis
VVDRAPLSVVVPTRNRPEHLRACVAALLADLESHDELLVLDSASSPPVALDDERVTVLRCDEAGASRARNAGWRAARHDLVAFVDDDVRVLPGWADAHVAAFRDEDVAFVTGAVGVPAGQEDRERPVAVTTLTSATRLTAETTGTLGASANLAVRVSALQEVGGFDERLGPGTWTRAAEDLDLFDRLFSSGHLGRFEPAAAAVHDQWRSRRELLRLDHGYGVGLGVRLVLLRRRGQRQRARATARDAVWEGTLLTGWRDLRKGYQFGALLALVRIAGTCTGAARAAVGLR